MTSINPNTAAALIADGKAEGYTVTSHVTAGEHGHTLTIKNDESLIEYAFSLDLLYKLPQEIELEVIAYDDPALKTPTGDMI